ncbi:uncharacterized protein LOC108630970 [Ceratina calcarata]|uniref:Uncharacterized protein LOC108630970 n=1 Tax=Ceratina calcarata TaxID=156304 RepID=A0AAJ7JCA6_9HYME|nr:uncharacterized protein LOC108630970 [Ceratina calcarata]
MAGSLLYVTRVLFLFLVNSIVVHSVPANKSVQNVPEPLIESALNFLNQYSPTHHTYKGGNLINAQELDESPYVIYRLTFDLTPICKETLEPCPKETCTIDVKKHELGDIHVLRESTVCMYLMQDDILQENTQNQDQVVDNVEKQIIANQTTVPDGETQNNDHNESPFIANRISDPNYCPGCPYELNPNLPGLAVFGEQAARSMDESIRNDFKHKVVEIVQVHRAVPPSSNVVQYQILLRLGESDCLKNAVDQPECSLLENHPIKLCLVTFEEQPWQQSTRRITRNNCTTNDNAEINIERKENVDSYSGLASQSLVTPGPKREETNREKSEALENLRDSLDDYTTATIRKNAESDLAEVTEHPILKVILNKTDDDTMVEGFKDRAKEFGEFLQDFDLPTRETLPTSEPDKEEVKEEIIYPKKVDSTIDRKKSVYRRKRSGLVGAPSTKNIDDPYIQEIVQKGLQKFSENSEGSNEPMIVQIVEASEQVVSGTLYKVKVKLGTSNCPKGTKNNCQLKEGSEVKDCLITAWSQPWIDHGSPKITVNCDLSNNRRKRSLKGSQYSEKMLRMAEEIEHEGMFEDFIKKFNKTYDSPRETQNRFKIFRQNLKLIKDLQMFERGTAEYGVTMFADLTPKEFKARHLGFRRELRLENDIPLAQAAIPDIPLPPKFDWRDHGVVTPVKDQGQCGSCWAFSVTGNVEGQYAIKHAKLLSLSEQELLDCDTLDEGCNGGEMTNAYKAIEALGGLETESDYPYDEKDEKCTFKRDEAKVQVTSSVNITTNETQIAQWLVKHGPISIGINANAMQFYIGGVSHPPHFLCSPTDLDHGVLIVGYGKSKYPIFHKELPYWIIKNSWGASWGEHGYYRVYRGDGTCGVNMEATSAMVA